MNHTLPRFSFTLSESSDFSHPRSFDAETSKAYQQDTLNIIEELRQLTISKQLIEDSTEASVSDIIAFDSRRNTLEERMLCSQHAFSILPFIRFGDHFLEICSIASTIYSCLTFRKFRLDFPLLKTLKQDLVTSIEKAETFYYGTPEDPIPLGDETPYTEMLLWVMFIGGLLTSDAEERTWFAHRIAKVLPWTWVRCWDDAEKCLKKVLWTDALCNSTCDRLWSEASSIAGLKLESQKSAGVVFTEDFDFRTLCLSDSGLLET